MVRTSTAAVGALGGLVAALGAWNLYRRATTEAVPYTVVDCVGGVELRRYPTTVLAETVAPSESEAFQRLFRYITGANEGASELAMTTPVAVGDEAVGASIPMTAPVEVERGSRGRPTSRTALAESTGYADGVRMAFYLPARYDVDSAPPPTDGSVELVAVPERTLAVRQFSWWATDGRVDGQTERLLAALDDSDILVVDDPFFMGYDAPGTLPFLRRNEVAVEVDDRHRE